MRVDRSVKELSTTLGRSPTVPELAAESGMDEEEVLAAMQASMAYEAVSMDAQRPSADAEGDSFADSMGEEDERYDLVEYSATIAPALKALPKRDRIVLHLRFVEDMTQSEIAERIGVSQMHVSRLLRRSLTQINDAGRE